MSQIALTLFHSLDESAEPTGTAVFSPCERYRYLLTRRIGPGDRRVLFVMLNPSTANAEKPDRTITRCIGFARAWGFDQLEVCNLFAWRSTDPKVLPSIADPIGPDNDRHLIEASQRADLLIVAWGHFAGVERRDLDVAEMLRRSGRELHCIELTQQGQPRHPLYLRGDLKPFPWRTR